MSNTLPTLATKVGKITKFNNYQCSVNVQSPCSITVRARIWSLAILAAALRGRSLEDFVVTLVAVPTDISAEVSGEM